MRELDRGLFCRRIEALQDFFDRDWDDATKALVLEAYYHFLRVVPEDQFESGVREAIATFKDFPTAKELRELCFDKTDAQRAFEASSFNIEQAISKYRKEFEG
jgi:GH25 family lysozyme M1 (1,4-beta-N-acetylmuramidase)